MWVVYVKSELKIVGLTAECEKDANKETALKEVVSGLVKPKEISAYNAIQVKDRENALEYMEAFPDKLVLKGPRTKPSLTIRDPETFSLHITTDAKDVHPVDGIPEIPADGKSAATITILKIDDRNKPQKGAKGKDQIYLRTDHGLLRDTKNTKDISSITLKNGKAAFKLVSEKAKRVATIQMLNTNPKLPDTSYQIEFI